MLPSPSLPVTILAFLLLLGPLVMVHELGHYLVGRLFKVKADAFSIGFGKELWGRTDRHGTRWKVSALPLGGYVQFAGDMNAAGMPDAKALEAVAPAERERLFQFKPLWQRALIVAAGPVVNLVLAVLIFTGFNLAYGAVVASTQIARFSDGSTAAAAGFKVGDRITAIDGNAIASFTEMPEFIAPFPGRTVTVSAIRNGREISLPVKIADNVETDRFGNSAHVGRIGILGGPGSLRSLGIGESLVVAVGQTGTVIKMMVTGIHQILVGDRSIRELGGPIKIAKISGEQLTLGWQPFVTFAALISINLAFINFLPIPGLDGGHLAFYAAEAVRRKPLDMRSQEWAFRTGLALVLALMLFVTLNDLAGLPLFGS